MHPTLQRGAHSPKQNNSPSSTSQLKPASDGGQNSGNSFSSQAKGKKRERGDHGVDHIKRGRFTRSDDGDPFHCKIGSDVKYEIATITEKGGVVDLEGIEKLIQLMQPDRKMDLCNRAMFASVLASTDNVDCLNRFVHLRGLPVLDGWLQDIHKGKIGDGSNLKDGGKSVDEFLLILLRALDKLPVNLKALQMCNIGRSVNHLRSHKNMEIQRKARTLVDTWKKRVEAEMMSIDAKSGSTKTISAWPSKLPQPEASHGGSRTPDGVMRNSITHNFLAKTTSGRFSSGESSMKYATSSPEPVKPASTPVSGKESQPKSLVGGSADASQIREDRSSSSNLSHNHGQSSVKDDPKSSISGSVTVNKISSNSIRNRRNNAIPGTSPCRSSSTEKFSSLEKCHSTLSSERVVEGPVNEESTLKLIVNIPNRVRTPGEGVYEGSIEDPNIMTSRASSPALPNKHEQPDHVSKDKSDASRCNVTSDLNDWQNKDQEDVLTGSPAVIPDEEQSMTNEGCKRLNESPSSDQLKLVKLHHSSFSPMNALVESCAKYSEATSSLSLEDDVGMNLLASVAAGEMSRSDGVSPSDSAGTVPNVAEVGYGDETKSKSYSEEDYDDDCDGKKQAVLDGCSGSDDGLYISKHAPLEFSGNKTCDPHSADDIPAADGSRDFDSSIRELRSNANPKWKNTEKSNEKTGMASMALPVFIENQNYGESNGGIREEKATFSNVIADGVSDFRRGGNDVMMTEEKVSTDHLSIDEHKLMANGLGSKPLEEGYRKKIENEGLNRASISQPKLSAASVESEFMETASNEDLPRPECGRISAPEAGGSGKFEDPDAKSCMSKSEIQKSNDVDVEMLTLKATSHDLSSQSEVAILENQEISEHLLPENQCPGSVKHEAQENQLTRLRFASIQLDEMGKCASTNATDPCEKMNFDLNEGFNDDDDDDEYGESVNLSTNVQMIKPLPFSLESIPIGHSASITVASAAKKGAFVPPEDLLISKVELGWKGSAATSAFRPAEPRKVVAIAVDPSNSSLPGASTTKHDCFPLDIDLNVADERVLEEIASRSLAFAVESTTDLEDKCASINEPLDYMPFRGSGGLDLDLNLVDETNDIGRCSTGSIHHGETSNVQVKRVNSLNIQRDFDLNDGPTVDDAQFSISHPVKGASQLPCAVTMNNPGPSSSSTSWFSPGNTYSIPSVLPDRGDQHFPVFSPGGPQRTFIPTGVTLFNPDMYRGSVLSSSPALPFPSSPFQYPIFPFGTNFLLPTDAFPVGGTSYPDSSFGARMFAHPVNSQYLGPVASQLQRPYRADYSNNGGLENRKWNRQGLDLNTGAGGMENEAKEEILPHSSGQQSVASFQVLAEDHARMFSVSGGSLKRKESEGSWDNEPVRHGGHPSWQ